MHWSDLSLRWKLIALAMLWATMFVVWVVVRWLAYDVLPPIASGFIAVAMVAFAIGTLFGIKSQQQLYEHGNPDWPWTRIKGPVDRLRKAALQGWWKLWTIAALAVVPIALVVILTAPR